MAYTERYVTSSAGGGGAGTSGDPWTLAEAFANAAAGDRVNIQSDAGYTIGTSSIANAGTQAQAVCFRGYNATIGDLEGQGRNSDTSLNITNYPAITLTGTLTTNVYTILQNLNITGSLSTWLFGSTSLDYLTVISCKAVNTASDGNAVVCNTDNYATFINCDFECSATTHGYVILSDIGTVLIGNRIKGASTASKILVTCLDNGIIAGNFFYGSSAVTGLRVEGIGSTWTVYNNTFYGIDTAITLPNLAGAAPVILVNNHVTDNSKWIDNLYSATSDKFVLEMNNRTRDNTTLRTGIGDGVNSGEVTTDTGGDETDYVDAPNGDITLIASAPAVDAGLGM